MTRFVQVTIKSIRLLLLLFFNFLLQHGHRKILQLNLSFNEIPVMTSQLSFIQLLSLSLTTDLRKPCHFCSHKYLFISLHFNRTTVSKLYSSPSLPICYLTLLALYNPFSSMQCDLTYSSI